jgi:hypothetical protein
MTPLSPTHRAASCRHVRLVRAFLGGVPLQQLEQLRGNLGWTHAFVTLSLFSGFLLYRDRVEHVVDAFDASVGLLIELTGHAPCLVDLRHGELE